MLYQSRTSFAGAVVGGGEGWTETAHAATLLRDRGSLYRSLWIRLGGTPRIFEEACGGSARPSKIQGAALPTGAGSLVSTIVFKIPMIFGRLSM